MRPTHVFADLSVPDLASARAFYSGFLGLDEQPLGLDWVTRFETPDGGDAVQLVTRDATAPVDAAISVTVGDGVDAAYEEARRRGYEIVHPLTTEPWGIRRFLVRAPDGTVVNVNSHSDR